MKYLCVREACYISVSLRFYLLIKHCSVKVRIFSLALSECVISWFLSFLCVTKEKQKAINFTQTHSTAFERKPCNKNLPQYPATPETSTTKLI